MVTTSTHSHGNNLDIVLTDLLELVSDVFVDSVSCSSYSDHFLVSFTIPVYHNVHNRRRHVFHYGQANLEGLFSFIEGIDFSVATHDVNSKWHILTESLFRARDLFIPSSLIYADSSPPWFNSEIRHRLNCIHTLHRRLKRNPCSSLSLCLAKLESSLTSLISSARSHYEEDLVNTFRFNSKCLYRYLKQK